MTEDTVTYGGRARMRSDVDPHRAATRIDSTACALCGTDGVAAVVSLEGPDQDDSLTLPADLPVCSACLDLLDSADRDAEAALAARLLHSYGDYGRHQVANYLRSHRADQ